MKHIIFFVLLSMFVFGCDPGVPHGDPSESDAGEVTTSACGYDNDCDGHWNNVDNCINVHNLNQLDTDSDTLGDACDPCPTELSNDFDKDQRCEYQDNCPGHYNPGQEDSDGDGFGNLCDQNDVNSAAIADLLSRVEALEAAQ
jgi:hypothetical protein